MQAKAAEDLRKLVTDGLVAAGLTYEDAKAFATPRRLALVVGGLPIHSPDQREEKKGPRVGAPDAAIQGFLKSAGLASIDQAVIQSDGKKGEVYIAVIERKGRATVDILAELLPGIIKSFPWPKSMRWGSASLATSSLRWVRPLKSILCTFGPETIETEIVSFEVEGIRSGNVTYGHRFMAPDAITVQRFEDYADKLTKAKVILDPARRKAMILAEARTLAQAQHLEVIEDEGLADEVAGLVEWPVVLMGRFDAAFLDIPAEVIRATIRANQKCFVLREAGSGRLAPAFLLTANIEAKDGGKHIIAGNERVVRARLSDARHFWLTDQGNLPDVADYRQDAEALGLDLTKPLDQRMGKLAHLGVVFHQKLGTQGERVQRIKALAEALAPLVGADPKLAARAAVLAKADLTSEMVGEFPELQGLMGRKYAALQGEHPSVCAAIEEHYKPLGPGDVVPNDPVSIAVALADKLDTLTGFWAIDEKPTGSKDPFALRRAALGVIRLAVENKIFLDLANLIHLFFAMHLGSEIEKIEKQESSARQIRQEAQLEMLHSYLFASANRDKIIEEIFGHRHNELWQQAHEKILKLTSDLLTFFHDRLKVQLREQGARHDLVDAVLASRTAKEVRMDSASSGASALVRNDAGMRGTAGTRFDPSTVIPAERSESRNPSGLDSSPSPGSADAKSPFPVGGEGRNIANDDLLLIVRRVEALSDFLKSEDGANLLAATKRAANILKAEEKKAGASFDGAVDAALIKDKGAPEEQALAAAISAAQSAVSGFIAANDYKSALGALAALRAPVDAFFDKILVNDPDPALRANRLSLLASLRATALPVADFSLIGG